MASSQKLMIGAIAGIGCAIAAGIYIWMSRKPNTEEGHTDSGVTSVDESLDPVEEHESKGEECSKVSPPLNGHGTSYPVAYDLINVIASILLIGDKPHPELWYELERAIDRHVEGLALTMNRNTSVYQAARKNVHSGAYRELAVVVGNRHYLLHRTPVPIAKLVELVPDITSSPMGNENAQFVGTTFRKLVSDALHDVFDPHAAPEELADDGTILVKHRRNNGAWADVRVPIEKVSDDEGCC